MRSAIKKDKGKDANVVIVRLKRGGLRFELSMNREEVPSKATLKDKNYKPNFLTLLSNQAIFSNAAKSDVAKPEDIAKNFSKDDGFENEEDIMKFILMKGDIQTSQEDRKEIQEEEQKELSKLAAACVNFCHVLPEEKEAPKKGGKSAAIRLQRYSADDIERELKNARYKPNSSIEKTDAVADAIHSIWRQGICPILRDGHMMQVTSESGDASLEEMTETVSDALPKGYFLTLKSASTKDTLRVVVDAQILKKAKDSKALKDLTLQFSSDVYVPQGSDDTLAAITPLTKGGKDEDAEGGAKKGSKKGGKKAGGKETAPAAKASKKGAAPQHKDPNQDDDSDEELTGLEAQLAKLKAEDSDDGKKGGKKGKGKPKPKPKAKPAPKAAAKKGGASDSESSSGSSSDSEEEEPQPTTMKPKKGKKK